MIRVTCYIRPHRLEAVKSALAALGISGMTVADVRGTGNSPEVSRVLAGAGHLVALPIRCRIMVVAQNELLEPMIDVIVENARTGEPGDGKIFVEAVLDAIRVRTEEKGESAV